MLGWIYLDVFAWMDLLGWIGLDGFAWMEDLDGLLGWICLDGLAWMDWLGWICLDGFAWMDLLVMWFNIITHFFSLAAYLFCAGPIPAACSNPTISLLLVRLVVSGLWGYFPFLASLPVAG